TEEKSYYMTEEGKEKVENELHDLKTVKRKEVVERIKTARDFGDLSENSEYDSAKEEQAFVETRMAHLENMIRNAVIIENDDEKESYSIVGSAEADPFEGKISNDSPMAKSLLGQEKGSEVLVQTPGDDIKVKIIDVQ